MSNALVSCHCGTTAYPSLALNDRMVLAPSCPACGAEHQNMQANDLSETPIAPSEGPKLAKVHQIRNSQISNVPEAPVDVVGMIRTRIAFLDTELARNAGYLAERKQLSRMLAAAEKNK